MKEETLKKRRLREFEAMKLERADALADAKLISKYLLPKRGIFQETKPRRRRINTTVILDDAGGEALKVLSSAFQGGYTPPSMPWFKYEWADKALKNHPILSLWLEDCGQRMYAELAVSGFYQAIHTFYTEVLGFGMNHLYVGEDSEDAAFRFENLTFGEYCISTNSKGITNRLYRIIWLSDSQFIDFFGKKTPQRIKDKVDRDGFGQDYYSVLECVVPEMFMNKPFKQEYYFIEGYGGTAFGNSSGGSSLLLDEDPLMIRGFYEFPYPGARMDVVPGSDYGEGLGEKAVPAIKRLQEMVKAMGIAAHKGIDPPVNIPAIMRGRTNLNPGGDNYYTDPKEVITSTYQVNFDYKGVALIIDGIHQYLKQLFLNDVFLTASRDPNASPLKAAEVYAKDAEKLLRLGPAIERIGFECIQAVHARCFNIMLRKGKFQPLPPEIAELAGAYNIRLTSVLAQAQKAIAARPIEGVVNFIGGLANLVPETVDLLDSDEAVRQYSEVSGAPIAIIARADKVAQKRDQRAKAQQAQQQMQMQLMQKQASNDDMTAKANAAKTLSDAGVNVNGMQEEESAG